MIPPAPPIAAPATFPAIPALSADVNPPELCRYIDLDDDDDGIVCLYMNINKIFVKSEKKWKCIHPSNEYAFVIYTSETMCCPICLEETDSSTLLADLGCHNGFHVHCLAKWLKKGTKFNETSACPLCRTEIDVQDATAIPMISGLKKRLDKLEAVESEDEEFNIIQKKMLETKKKTIDVLTDLSHRRTTMESAAKDIRDMLVFVEQFAMARIARNNTIPVSV